MRIKATKINAWNRGLVFKDGNYRRMLTEGRHYIELSETVLEYNMAEPFKVKDYELNILLKDAELVNELIVVEVKQHEIALMYENGLFKSVLTAGRHAYWKGLMNYSFTIVDLNSLTIDESIDRSVLQIQQVAAYVRSFTIEPHEKGLLFVDGKFERMVEAGTYHFWRNATAVSILRADMRNQQLEVSGQEILSRDKAALRVSFFAQYKVNDVVNALLENKEYEKQLHVLLQLSLREFVGSLTLDEMLERKEQIASMVMGAVEEKAAKLGVSILNCGIRDIILPGEVKEIMNQVLVAEKKAQANTITRREETASTRSLLNTAKLMEENEMLFRLKEMEYVEKIADKIQTISLGGGTQVLDQMKQLFVAERKK